MRLNYLYLRSQWKKERDSKLNAARHAALANEKVMIESRIRVEDLPSWVFFPDKVCTLQSRYLHLHFPNNDQFTPVIGVI